MICSAVCLVRFMVRDVRSWIYARGETLRRGVSVSLPFALLPAGQRAIFVLRGSYVVAISPFSYWVMNIGLDPKRHLAGSSLRSLVLDFTPNMLQPGGLSNSHIIAGN